MTEREKELLRAVLAAVSDEATLRGLVEGVRAAAEEGDCSPELVDALDDLDAYCERCDDRGYTAHIVSRPSGWGTYATERPCTCEASRVLAEKRRAAR